MSLNLSVLPDLLAIGGLVLMFASLLRRTHQSRLRYWLVGWVMILVHIVAQMVYQNVPALMSSGLSVSLSMLLLASGAFVWAGHDHSSGCGRGFIWPMAAAVPDVIFIVAWSCGRAEPWLFAVLTALAALATLALLWRDQCEAGRRERDRLAGGVLLAYAMQILLVSRGQLELALVWMLCWHYLAAAYFFWRGAPRAGLGTAFTTICFLTWAAVFPVGYAVERWFPGLQINGEAWNLPKFLVATGMILCLLEEQVGMARHAAAHDPLTGLPNRRLFVRRLDEALERARRSSMRVALLVIDMDDFKRVNDTRGHAAGDALLCFAAQRLQATLRRNDTLARLGGDEFGAIIPDLAPGADIDRLVEELRSVLDEGLDWQGQRYPIRASIGVSFYPDDGSDEACLYAAADRAMYAHKQKAREERVAEG